jgi:hypothetical protein
MPVTGFGNKPVIKPTTLCQVPQNTATNVPNFVNPEKFFCGIEFQVIVEGIDGGTRSDHSGYHVSRVTTGRTGCA